MAAGVAFVERVERPDDAPAAIWALDCLSRPFSQAPPKVHGQDQDPRLAPALYAGL
jgi:hypothetical protein